MKQAIVFGILKAVGCGVKKNALEIEGGFVGSYSMIFKLFPVIGIVLFTAFGVFAVQDPDPRDQAVSVIGFGAAILFIWLTIYRFTHRIVYKENQFEVTSMVSRINKISLNEPFDFSWEDDKRAVKLKQNKNKVIVNCMISGYSDFFDIVEKHSV